MKRMILAAVAALLMSVSALAEEPIKPTGTYCYADCGTCRLLLDVYAPTPGSQTSIGDRRKPTVLFMFGGGFAGGERDNRATQRWYKMLADEGYGVVAIDYRLGLKDFQGKPGINKAFVQGTRAAIDMAVDDLYAATLWLLEHGSEVGVDARNMVVSGSSAGAITVMQAEYELANRTARCAQMPADFNYAGVIAFAGAIYSLKGGPRYATEPCPTLFLHGTDDKIVPYRKLQIGRIFFGGAKPLCKKFDKGGYNYNAYHYLGHGHEIAGNMILSFPEEIRFLETNVTRGQRRIIDTEVDDPDVKLPDWGKGSYKKLYK